MINIKTAEEFFEEELSGEPLTQDSVIEGLKEYAEQYCEEKMKDKIIELLGIEITDADKGEFTIDTAALVDIILTNKQ